MDLKQLKEKLDGVIVQLRTEIAGLRTGRASPALVEDIEVEYYGTKTPMKAVASVSCPEPRTVVIAPWDKGAMPAIEKAIQSSSLGLNPIAERDVIRLTIPSLTEERRKEMTKLLGRHIEDARIEVRKTRDEALKSLETREKQKEIGEDEKFRLKNEAQKLIDEANKKIEDIASAKEKEIMTV